ncbi:MAG TPA: PQQ-dependent sugar dehydrogenase [Nocardioides sp.]|nr:PQQ-dependent sugar dehydrogenase [Nocardioides sp.]
MRLGRTAAAIAAIGVLTTLGGCGGNSVTITVAPSMTAVPTVAESVPATFDGVPDVIGTAASKLTSPWGLAFLRNGVAVVTERTTGRVLLVNPDDDGGAATVTDLGTIKGLNTQGDGGLLGVAVSPTFDADSSLYFYETTKKDNRVVQMPLTDAGLGRGKNVLTGIPRGAKNNGGQLAFGPDGYLYVGTGDAGKPQLAQSKKSLAGKILRIAGDGSGAPGNPGKNQVWTRGFRDVVGLAFDGDGQLWATDDGPHQDELNRVLPGSNGAWPVHEGAGGDKKKFIRPSVTWAPARATPGGLAFVGGYLWLTGVRGQDLWRVKVDGGAVGDSTPYFAGTGKHPSTYGALRIVALSPNGQLWVGTGNADGARHPGGDDRLLLIQP